MYDFKQDGGGGGKTLLMLSLLLLKRNKEFEVTVEYSDGNNQKAGYEHFRQG